MVGDAVGVDVGDGVCTDVGVFVGNGIAVAGASVGCSVGDCVVGDFVGVDVGERVGADVGALVQSELDELSIHTHSCRNDLGAVPISETINRTKVSPVIALAM